MLPRVTQEKEASWLLISNPSQAKPEKAFSYKLLEMCYYNRERTLECTAFNCARVLPYTEQSAISTIAQCSPMTTEPNKCVENLQPFATQSASLHLNSERRCHPLCNGCDGNQTNYGQTPSPLVPRPSHPVGEFGCLLYGVFLLGSLRTCMF